MSLFFIKNIPVKITLDESYWHNTKYFDFFFEGRINNVKYNKIKGKIIIKINNINFSNWVKTIMIKGGTKLESITFLLPAKTNLISHIEENFKIVNAAGGVVKKGKDILMVFRNGKWELPKGKLEKGESYETAAIREIEEECNVSSEILNKICSTWYTYMVKGKIYFKHVIWFNMICKNDENMKPQLEEGITKVDWISPNRLDSILSNSYLSINYIIDEYLKIN